MAPADRSSPSPLLVQALVALLCLLWGSTWLVIREGLRDLPPLTSAGVRFAISFAVMVALAPALHRRETGDCPPAWLWSVVGTLNFAASYAIVYTTETVLPSGLTSVLWAVFPLMMAVAGHAVLGEIMRPAQWLGFGLGFIGVCLLFVTDLDDVERLGPDAVPAALLLFVSPLVSAVGQTCLKRFGSGASSILLNRNAMGLGAAWLLGAALAFERDATVRWTPTAIGSIVYLALFGTVTTFSLYFWLLRHAPATRLSVIAFVTPLIALTLGWVFGGETITAATATGAALVVLGVALAVVPRGRLRAAAERSVGDQSAGRSGAR
ncbi:MAG: EamA family transporter [Planctomycetes bacterium]|nr:EamA family transporter [Planctomycetota bacterium]